MRLKALLFAVSLLAMQAVIGAASDVSNFRFGTLRPTSEGGYVIDVETTTIPRLYKASGLRFGLSFDNPTCKDIQWYYVIELPSQVRQTTGNLRKAEPGTLKTKVQRSKQCIVVDDFWFDEGDPLGRHRMHLYVNGSQAFSVEFQVVER